MKDLLTEFDEETPPSETIRLKEAFMFWFKKRWLYNFILLVAGWLAMYAFGSKINWVTIIDIVFFALAANLGFSLGYSLDSFFIFFKPQSRVYEQLRPILFWAGTGVSILVVIISISSFS